MQHLPSAPAGPPLALAVDWGGVLTSDLPQSMSAWAQADEVDPAVFIGVMQQWGLGATTGAASPVARFERGELAAEEFEQLLAAELARAGAPVAGQGLLGRIFEHFAHAHDMSALVERSRAAGIRTALLSNSWGEHYPRHLFARLFDVVVISGEVGMRKPEPQIFELTVARLGVLPHQVVFVDDLEVNVAAARAAGLRGLHHVDYRSTSTALEELFGIPLA